MRYNRLMISAICSALLAFASTVMTATQGSAPITSNQWIFIVASMIAAFAKDVQAGYMQPPGTVAIAAPSSIIVEPSMKQPTA